MKQILIVLMILVAVTVTGCKKADEGTRLLKITPSGIEGVIKPADGYVNSARPTVDYDSFNIRVFTLPVDVTASTKDNAAVHIHVQATILPPQDDNEIISYVRKFGIDESERWGRMIQVVSGQINTEVKNAVSEHEAYSLLASQHKIQTDLLEKLRPILKSQVWMNLESLQIIGRPNFDDQRIEQAAASVVTNQKGKEAAEAALATAKVNAEQKQIEAQNFSNPALFKIKELELQLEIERVKAEGIAKHQGPLTIVNGAGSGFQVQLKGADK